MLPLISQNYKGSQEITIINHVNKWGNLEGMDKFLETYHLSGLNQECIENSDKSESNTICAVLKYLSSRKSSGFDSFTTKLCKISKEKVTLIRLTLFQDIRKARVVPNALHDFKITLNTKTNQQHNPKMKISD